MLDFADWAIREKVNDSAFYEQATPNRMPIPTFISSRLVAANFVTYRELLWLFCRAALVSNDFALWVPGFENFQESNSSC